MGADEAVAAGELVKIEREEEQRPGRASRAIGIDMRSATLLTMWMRVSRTIEVAQWMETILVLKGENSSCTSAMWKRCEMEAGHGREGRSPT